jgi:hypothetical protein
VNLFDEMTTVVVPLDGDVEGGFKRWSQHPDMAEHGHERRFWSIKGRVLVDRWRCNMSR